MYEASGGKMFEQEQKKIERAECTIENCGHMRQLNDIIGFLGMPRGGISVTDYLKRYWPSVQQLVTVKGLDDALCWLRVRFTVAEDDELSKARAREYGEAQYAQGLAAAYAFAILHVERLLKANVYVSHKDD
jgi:hypothetical protein